jgi:AcrR family transcriptional regulator
MRRDADRNRTALLEAARELFAVKGPEVPLEDVARRAGVSRTTLYRHFKTREELAATILEANVTAIEAEAARLAGSAGGIRLLFDFVLEMQHHDQGVAYMLSGVDVDWFAELSQRTAHAFTPLIAEGRQEGVVHAGVDVADFLLAFPMASGVHADAAAWGREVATDRTRAMLHRALFTR